LAPIARESSGNSGCAPHTVQTFVQTALHKREDDESDTIFAVRSRM